MAPKFVDRGKVGRACDIYSLGVLILAIVMGEGPKTMLDPSGVMFIKKVSDPFGVKATHPQRGVMFINILLTFACMHV
jgi:serine/threonine protein kinase